MIPTPTYSHLQSNDFDHIYEPAEDTFLLLDALESDKHLLNKFSPSVCVEVGCGSGVCLTFLAKLLPPYSSAFFCTDINAKAVVAADRTAEENGVTFETVLTDLLGGLEERLAGLVDVLLFNPPYVVTDNSEVGGRSIQASWAGGDNGRVVTDRLLPIISQLLSPDGIFYIVAIKENKPDEIAAILGKQGLFMETVLSRRSGSEHLSVLRFSRHRYIAQAMPSRSQ